MTEPYYQDGAVALYHGDAAVTLAGLPDRSVDCIVTSPPYFGLRDYGQDGQIGAEPSPAAFVAALVAVFREARRVLVDDGTFWLNLGDSYANDGKWGGSSGGKHVTALHGDTGIGRGKRTTGLAPKNLIGIPWRVAFALQDDGWILRNDIIWHKPNAMPESVTDRLSNRHEHLFLFSKKPRYWFDLDPIREPILKGAAGSEFHTGKTGEHQLGRASSRPRTPWGGVGAPQPNLEATGARHTASHDGGRNPGDVWTIATQPFSEAHFATFPPALPERCIQAGCKPGGTVLDPFSGSGTTGLAAARHGRKYVGIDLNRDYLDLSLRTRLAQTALLGGGAA